jgi:hypothetical protein
MKPYPTKYLILLLFVLISCATPDRFVRLTNDKGRTKLASPQRKICYLILIDSLKFNPCQYDLLSLKKDSNGVVQANSYWRIWSFDSAEQTITFQNCSRDTMMVILRKEQILFLSPIPGVTISARDAVDIVTIPAFLLGTIGTAWGLISLPFPSTPWQEDLKLIRGGVIALGIFGLATVISESAQPDSSENKYRIESIH